MNYFIFLISISLVLTSCQLNYKPEQLAEFDLGPTSNRFHLPAVAQRIDKETKIARYRQKDYEVKLELMSHGQFVFLEFAELNEEEIASLPVIPDEAGTISNATTVFDLTDHPYFSKYEKFIGRTISIYDVKRIKRQPTIKKIVLVKDMAYEKPYVALKLNLSDTTQIYAAFATSNKRMNPYLYAQIEDAEISQIALAHFDSLNEVQLVKSRLQQENPDANFDEYNVHVFDYRENEKYVFVQAIYLGNCSSYETGYSVLYHVTRDNWVQEAEGEIPHFFKDLIDIDGDKYPELFFTDFADAFVYEITHKGFTQKRAITWSTDECPC
ncbi:MAG: hypothetical protein IPO32_01405 [Crocinitomicaceae bacterium]|nr:hypothetical protein [Crocinitomicaceae bacterium]